MAEATGGAPEGEGERVLSVMLIDQSGVEYQLEVRLIKAAFARLATRLLRAPDGVVTFAEGSVRGIIRRTGQVYEVDSPLAVVRPRFRAAGDQED